METILNSLLSGISDLSPIAQGFALGFAVWVCGAAISAIFRAFTVGSGLDSNDED